MLIAMEIPEGVLMCAFSERREAKRLCAACHKRFLKARKSFAIEGAFFVMMGGSLTVSGQIF